MKLNELFDGNLDGLRSGFVPIKDRKNDDFFKKWFTLPYLTNGYTNQSMWLAKGWEIDDIISKGISDFSRDEKFNSKILISLNRLKNKLLKPYGCVDNIRFYIKNNTTKNEHKLKIKLVNDKIVIKVFYTFNKNGESKLLSDNIVRSLLKIKDFIFFAEANGKRGKALLDDWNSRVLVKSLYDENILVTTVASELYKQYSDYEKIISLLDEPDWFKKWIKEKKIYLDISINDIITMIKERMLDYKDVYEGFN
jgi:hypothetical protein